MVRSLMDITPFGKGKGYLSWSAINLWNQSKERYRKQYYEDSKRVDTIYTSFGKKIHEKLEKDPMFLPDVDRTGLREQAIETNLDGVPLKGYVDYIDLRCHLVRDYKTSKKRWTPLDVMKSQQLILYALMIESEYGIEINDVDILWIETAEQKKETKIGSVIINNTPELNLTGHYEIVKRPEPISKKEKVNTVEMVKTASDEIMADYSRFTA